MKAVFKRADDGEKELKKSFGDVLKELDVRTVPRPKEAGGIPLNPVLPSDLTLLDDVELGRLFSEFACMAQYVKLRLAVKAVMFSYAKRGEKIVRAKTRLEKSGTVEDKSAKVEVDPRVREASFQTLVSEGADSLTDAVMECYLIGRDMCNREQTRRQIAYEKQR